MGRKPIMAREIYRIAQHLEATGNHGSYPGNIKRAVGVKPTEIPKSQRDGILFYSRGWGWRLRTHPHWKNVFAKRFPTTFAELLDE